MSAKIKRCAACLGSGKILPEVAPWDRLIPGACPVCDGNGYPGTVRLKSLCVGDIWQDIHGHEFAIVRKDSGGCVIVHQSGPHAGVEEYAPHDPPARVIRRADVAFFLPPQRQP